MYDEGSVGGDACGCGCKAYREIVTDTLFFCGHKTSSNCNSIFKMVSFGNRHANLHIYTILHTIFYFIVVVRDGCMPAYTLSHPPKYHLKISVYQYIMFIHHCHVHNIKKTIKGHYVETNVRENVIAHFS